MLLIVIAIFAWTIKYQKHDQIEAGHITKAGKKDIPVTYNIYYNFCSGSYQLELISWSTSFFQFKFMLIYIFSVNVKVMSEP